jgi:hypothetical protein
VLLLCGDADIADLHSTSAVHLSYSYPAGNCDTLIMRPVMRPVKAARAAVHGRQERVAENDRF